MKPHEIPGRVALTIGQGGLTKINVITTRSTAEIYLHGAHVTGFQKNGEPPLLFMSAQSLFAPGKAIRGGVPICFPWFGPRTGDAAHGFARVTEWQLVKTAATDDRVTIHLRLPSIPARPDFNALQTEYIVTVSDQLSLELRVTNTSAQPVTFENCLHTYFAISDISQVSLTGLKGLHYLDKVDNLTRKIESGDALRVSSEVDRVYQDATDADEIHDPKWRRRIRVTKTGSVSTVVWNPWIAKAQAMSDFGDDEYQRMLCVESGNVGDRQVSLPPGQTASLLVHLASHPA